VWSLSRSLGWEDLQPKGVLTVVSEAFLRYLEAVVMEGIIRNVKL